MLSLKRTWFVAVLALAAATVACGDDDDDTQSSPQDGGSAGKGSAMAGKGSSGMKDAGPVAEHDAGTTEHDASGKSLCEKYGGKEAIAGVVSDYVVDGAATDCRISGFFADLSNDQLTRLVECLSIQTEELFGCEGVHYAGSEASNGLPCRSMAAAHAGMGVSSGDFDALIEDVVAGLVEAGVEQKDIDVAAPALLGLKPMIVEKSDVEDPSAPMCSEDGGV